LLIINEKRAFLLQLYAFKTLYLQVFRQSMHKKLLKIGAKAKRFYLCRPQLKI
jgi:hypothetical protein